MARDAVGLRLRQARKLRGLTQQELATASGVAQAIISETETGAIKSPSGPNLAHLAHALRVSSQWLANNKGPMEMPRANHDPTPTDLSPAAIRVARNWQRLSSEVGQKFADMLEEMVKVSGADNNQPENDVPNGLSRTGRRPRKTI